jgi:hypothetical protein
VKEALDLSKGRFQFVNGSLAVSKNDAIIGVNQDDAVIADENTWINF